MNKKQLAVVSLSLLVLIFLFKRISPIFAQQEEISKEEYEAAKKKADEAMRQSEEVKKRIYEDLERRGVVPPGTYEYRRAEEEKRTQQEQRWYDKFFKEYNDWDGLRRWVGKPVAEVIEYFEGCVDDTVMDVYGDGHILVNTSFSSIISKESLTFYINNYKVINVVRR